MLLEMTFITVLYSNSYYCLRNILLLKFMLLGVTLIIVLAHQSYMGARGSCRYDKKQNKKCQKDNNEPDILKMGLDSR